MCDWCADSGGMRPRDTHVKVIHCKAVLFDLDGVLVDSTRCIERHWREWASRHGRDPNEILRIAHGRRTVETLQMIAPELDIAAEVAALAASEAVDMDGVDVITGASELLHALPPRSWTVVTSGTREVARARLQHCELPVPGSLITADDVVRGKPSPEGYLTAARALHCEPEECVVVEDSPAGIEAAHAAGMRIIATASTHAPTDLRSADVVVRSVSDIDVRREDGRFELLISEFETS